MNHAVYQLLKSAAAPIRSVPAIWDLVWDFRKWVAANRFLYCKAEAARIYQEFSDCRSPEDFFHLSRRLLGPVQIQGEITGLLEMARSENIRTACEIGTAQGGTNFLLTHALRDVDLMLAVDLHVKNKAKLNFFMRGGKKLCCLEGSSYASATVEKARIELNGRPLDLLFIDGDHRFEGVKADFLGYRQFVREGGIIAFHDIVPDYTTRLGKKTRAYAGGVPQFWSKLKMLYRWQEFIDDPGQDACGIGVIRYDPGVDPSASLEEA